MKKAALTALAFAVALAGSRAFGADTELVAAEEARADALDARARAYGAVVDRATAGDSALGSALAAWDDARETLVTATAALSPANTLAPAAAARVHSRYVAAAVAHALAEDAALRAAAASASLEGALEGRGGGVANVRAWAAAAFDAGEAALAYAGMDAAEDALDATGLAWGRLSRRARSPEAVAFDVAATGAAAAAKDAFDAAARGWSAVAAGPSPQLGVDRAALARDEDAAWAAAIAARAAWDAALRRANADARGAYAAMLTPSLAAVAVRDGALAGGAAVAEAAAVGRPAVPSGGGGGPVAAVPALIPAVLKAATWAWAGWDWANSASIPDAVAEGRAAYDRAKEAGHSHAEALDLATDVAAARVAAASGGALATRGAAAIAKQALKHALLKRFSAPAKAAGEILDLYDKAQTATDAMDHSGLLPRRNHGTGGTTATDNRGGGTDDAAGTGHPHDKAIADALAAAAAAKAAQVVAEAALADAEAAAARGDCDASREAWADAYSGLVAAEAAVEAAENAAESIDNVNVQANAAVYDARDARGAAEAAEEAAYEAYLGCGTGMDDGTDDGAEGGTPDAPELRLSRVTDTEIHLEWPLVAGVTHYRFHYHRPDGSTHQFDPIPVADATGRQRFFDLTPGTEYCFTLTALVDDVESAHSARVCGTTTDSGNAEGDGADDATDDATDDACAVEYAEADAAAGVYQEAADAAYDCAVRSGDCESLRAARNAAADDFQAALDVFKAARKAAFDVTADAYDAVYDCVVRSGDCESLEAAHDAASAAYVACDTFDDRLFCRLDRHHYPADHRCAKPRLN